MGCVPHENKKRGGVSLMKKEQPRQRNQFGKAGSLRTHFQQDLSGHLGTLVQLMTAILIAGAHLYPAGLLFAARETAGMLENTQWGWRFKSAAPLEPAYE